MSADRGYLNLVAHLSRPSTSLPLTTVLGSVAHHLARAAPSATPLAASVVSSALFRAHAHADLDGLLTACRHAVHLKLAALEAQPGGLFARSTAALVAEWVAQVLQGLQGGHAVLRLACCAGLLHGMVDREAELKLERSSARRTVEEEFLVALAEVVEYASAPAAVDPWQAEFRSKVQQEQDAVPAALAIASRSLPFVAPHRLGALPLLDLCRILQSSLNKAFWHNVFFRELQTPFVTTESGKLAIANDSPIFRTIEEVSSGLLLTHMATISAMYAQVISVLADSRPADAWTAVSKLVQIVSLLAKTAEDEWSLCPLASVDDDESLASQTKEVAVKMWTIFKTLLFTSVRLLQQAMSVVLFVPPPPASLDSADKSPTPFSITHATLGTLSHLSFILPRFGGVSSTASSALPELLKGFYTALDVLSTSADESRVLVRKLQKDVNRTRQRGLPAYLLKAKEAYALACVEQLVAVLDDRTMRDDVWQMCEPHLNDPSHRETYESAHSVMLAMFSAHAKKRRAGSASAAVNAPSSLAATTVVETPALQVESETISSEESRWPFAEQVVPAYAKCLIDNSSPDKLNTTQLRLAFAALVGCASVFGSSRDSATSKPDDRRARTSEGDAYAWFCIALLLEAIKARPNIALSDREKEHRQKLVLTLISTVPSVSLRLLPRLLGSILEVLESLASSADADAQGSSDDHSDREELAKTLFEELLNVGDEEKEHAMRWWGEHKRWVAGWVGGPRGAEAGGEREAELQPPTLGKGKARETAARL
ncbi:hypothetical protein PsYK624_145130 [Phanerochaete sordida]|uniref:Uncharacterized protein n=1 Tax=Phanerochaete sordida TaxID=48140 RepID=A0A9P3GMS8_9APHY|nr:hypothetical protein PsYK624_145130 [Phanerochaete sordida]